MDKEEEKRALIEEMGIHFESEYSLPPLAARIFANLVITEETGLTFDDCKVKRGASKSSISTALNLLLQIGFINYFTKSGDRKRYFKIAVKGSFFIKKLNKELNKLEKETFIVNKVQDYFKKHNPERYNEDEEMKNIYLTCLKNNKEIFKDSINKLKKI